MNVFKLACLAGRIVSETYVQKLVSIGLSKSDLPQTEAKHACQALETDLYMTIADLTTNGWCHGRCQGSPPGG